VILLNGSGTVHRIQNEAPAVDAELAEAIEAPVVVASESNDDLAYPSSVCGWGDVRTAPAQDLSGQFFKASGSGMCAASTCVRARSHGSVHGCGKIQTGDRRGAA